jgi:hypothetical protein
MWFLDAVAADGVEAANAGLDEVFCAALGVAVVAPALLALFVFGGKCFGPRVQAAPERERQKCTPVVP